MKKKITLGAHWYSRPETLETCAKNIVSFLIKLRDFDKNSFGEWYLKGRSKKDAKTTIVIFEYNFIEKLIGSGQDKNSFPQISYTASFWSGGDDDSHSSSISFSLGSIEEQYYTNHCIIKTPNENSNAMLEKLLCSFWKPEWLQIDDKKITI